MGRPLWWVKNYSVEVVSDLGSLLKTKMNLSEENMRLNSELNQVNSQLLFSQSLAKENQALKEMLGRKTEEQKFVLANVLAKPNLSPYDSLILDVGQGYDIKKGDLVALNNFILGEVEDVYAKTTKVRLYSFPGEELNVAVGFNKIISIAKGKGGGNFEIKLPRDILIEKGDLVFLPEKEEFPLGFVESFSVSPEDPLQTILFKTPVNIFELRWVQILREE